jgi:hypothetical protein
MSLSLPGQQHSPVARSKEPLPSIHSVGDVAPCGRPFQDGERFCPRCGASREDCTKGSNGARGSKVAITPVDTSASTNAQSGRWAVSASEIAAVAEPTPRLKDPKSMEKRVMEYEAAGLPWGLSELLAKEDTLISMRIFILDNSSSTVIGDGHLLAAVPDRRCFQFTPASRWEEIKATAVDQAWWSARVGVRTEFVVMNPLPWSKDTFVVDCEAGDPHGQVLELKNFLDQQEPTGGSPLVQRLKDVRVNLLNRKSLNSHVMLTVVTDGLPTAAGEAAVGAGDATISLPGDAERKAFVEELRRFATQFNSTLVIRLATDDMEVIDFYNRIDDEFDLPLDIIDDLQGEAAEVHMAGNGWLVYTPMIHRIREAGVMDKLFDLIDEKKFTPTEIATFLDYIIRRKGDPPFPTDPDKLLEAAQFACQTQDVVFDGKSAKMSPPVDLKLLSRALRKTSTKHHKADKEKKSWQPKCCVM